MPIEIIFITTPRQGLFEFTGQVANIVLKSRQKEGLCTLFIKHTSASLTIQENADPSVKYDLEQWFNSLVPENDSYTHTTEGADDMPAHIKSALTTTSLSIPIFEGKLTLGTWQGIFLWEHRHHGGRRAVVVHIGN